MLLPLPELAPVFTYTAAATYSFSTSKNPEDFFTSMLNRCRGMQVFCTSEVEKYVFRKNAHLRHEMLLFSSWKKEHVF